MTIKLHPRSRLPENAKAVREDGLREEPEPKTVPRQNARRIPSCH